MMHVSHPLYKYIRANNDIATYRKVVFESSSQNVNLQLIEKSDIVGYVSDLTINNSMNQ